ncbi:MAG: hydrolase [Burkholderia sp.]|nr:hydrolase [Burkholderia sp.]
MPAYHPVPDEHGKAVVLKQPSQPTALSSWAQAHAVATVIPNGDCPAALNGTVLGAWSDVPTSPEEWNQVEGQCECDEPPFNPPPGKMPAAGVVIEESDGRFWLVAPSNAFGGYKATFPKGRIDGDVSRQASAIREAYEEAGLKVRITGFFADSNRSQSYTRYYLAQRVGGNPALMGWESQAVHLVPRVRLADFLTHPNDLPLLAALLG